MHELKINIWNMKHNFCTIYRRYINILRVSCALSVVCWQHVMETGTFKNMIFFIHNNDATMNICIHYSDVIMRTMASQITSLTIVCSIPYSDTDKSSASLAFVRGIHRWPVNSPHKGTVTGKVFPFDDVIKFTEKKMPESWISLATMLHISTPTWVVRHSVINSQEMLSIRICCVNVIERVSVGLHPM